MKKPEHRCVIDNRFRVVNCPDRVEIFDRKNPQEDDRGNVPPFGVVPLKARVTTRDACLTALGWLRDHGHISKGDYLVDAEKLMLHASVEPEHYAEKPNKDCIE